MYKRQFSTRIGSTVFEDGCLEGWNKDYADILLTDEPYKDVRCTKEIFNNAREKYPDMLAVCLLYTSCIGTLIF